MFTLERDFRAENVAVARTYSLPMDKMNGVDHVDPTSSFVIAKSLTSLKSAKVFFSSETELDPQIAADSSETITSTGNESQGSSLTTLNIAKHNHQLFQRRGHSPGHSPTSNNASSPETSFIESFGSSSSESHHTAEVKLESKFFAA